jgi:hypothetical protein
MAYKCFVIFQVSNCSPGMWPVKVCLHYVCYIIMIVLCVVSLHARPTSRTKGLNIDKNVLQRFKQTLANQRLQKSNDSHDFRHVLDDLENIYSQQGMSSSYIFCILKFVNINCHFWLRNLWNIHVVSITEKGLQDFAVSSCSRTWMMQHYTVFPCKIIFCIMYRINLKISFWNDFKCSFCLCFSLCSVTHQKSHNNTL